MAQESKRQDRDRPHREMNPDTIFPPSQPEYGLTGDALHQDQVEEGGVGTAPGPKEGLKRHPTEDPGDGS